MESDVNSKKKKKFQNASTNYDRQAESSSLELDKAKTKVLHQSNPLVNNINGLTKTNGITGLSVHTSDVRNGKQSEKLTCYNVKQGEIKSSGSSTEISQDVVGHVNGETRNSGKEDVKELRASPTENGYKDGSSDSEDEVSDGKSKEKEHISKCISNASHSESENISEKKNGQPMAMQSNSLKMQAARPKTISWSRMVKHRRDKKNNFNRCKNKSRNSSSSKLGYIYPELCTSSDDDFEDVNFLVPGRRNSSERNKSCQTSANVIGYCEENGIGKRHIENDADSNQNILIGLTSNAVDTNCQNFESDGNGSMPTFNNVDIMNSSLLSAPLALPEDSDGYSTNSSDSNTQLPVTSCPNTTTTAKVKTSTTTSRTLITQTSQFIYTERTTIDSICFEEHKNIEQAMRPKHLRPNSSVDSLEEIGDYIETDFPNKDSRLLFQCSSRSSSSTDEDEGYGVNEVFPNTGLEQEGERFPRPPVSTNFTLTCTHNMDTNQLGSDVSGNNSNFFGCNNVNLTFPPHQSKRSSRLGSSTGRSESGSELGGMLGGSDSSAVYSPETDYMEFLDMDQPYSIGEGQKSLSLDLIDPCLSTHNDDTNDNNSNSVNLDYLDDNGSCVINFGTNDLQGAEGGLTNDLNFDCKSDDFDPDTYNNMESYDPHLADFGNENFHYHDTCKHEKVPKANFKNSESNRKEKIFFKCAMDGNQSSSSGSSDDEENLLHGLPREVMFNSDRPPQNGDDADCMVLEDLEHLTHALQNAVIMQLPSKLEESSG
ncbi:hypothetical protein KUTeg_019395 [Tegillarca granosa]|uniref:Uncharacterized protein n=1 Tax=Tegillarca granosa TaxID=220873 RepID=A0ABQ9EEH9_TEGGR|nr:hypothetical protein KUTeg_019395 [Tegillarca granosa]